MSLFILVRYLSDAHGIGAAGTSNSVVTSVCPKNWNKPMMMEGIGLNIFFFLFYGFPVMESPSQ